MRRLPIGQLVKRESVVEPLKISSLCPPVRTERRCRLRSNCRHPGASLRGNMHTTVVPSNARLPDPYDSWCSFLSNGPVPPPWWPSTEI
jgi:hypothetical protein